MQLAVRSGAGGIGLWERFGLKYVPTGGAGKRPKGQCTLMLLQKGLSAHRSCHHFRLQGIHFDCPPKGRRAEHRQFCHTASIIGLPAQSACPDRKLLSSWCAICLACLFQPFMKIWMGQEMMLPPPSVFLLVIYFYQLKLGDMITLYSAAKGLWWKHRYRSIGETMLNTILNVVLGKQFGVNGIITATIVSLFLCNNLWSRWIIFKHYFGLERLKEYFFYQVRHALIFVAALLCSFLLCNVLLGDNAVYDILLRSVICMIVPNAIYCFAFHKTDVFQSVVRKIVMKH